MEVLVVADGHYYQTPDGTIYVDSVYDYNFYKRYLSAFDHVYAAVRITMVESALPGKKISSGENVTFLDLPPYTGPFQYAKKYLSIFKRVNEICQKADCAIFRIPAATSNLFCKQYSKRGKPFAVEVVIDPWENFAPGTISTPLRPIIRYMWTKLVKEMCAKANGVAYVTEKYLQEKYPSKKRLTGKGFEGSYSSVELPDEKFNKPKKYTEKKTWIIAHSANTFADYGKGHIPLMKAVQKVRNQGYDVHVQFIGDGPKREEFQKYAQRLGVSESIHFIGKLPSSVEVKEVLRESDLFVFPTRAEGLPRGLLEAMSEGLPCISSPACGIPEILNNNYLYDYEDINGFASGIIRFISNPELMEKESFRNLNVSRKYATSVLSEKRKAFYTLLREEVERVKKKGET